MFTDEILIRYDSERRVFEFRQTASSPVVPLAESAMDAAVAASHGTQLEKLLGCLVDQARKNPGAWHSASSEPVVPGQAVL